jgi:hypothetical protein
MGTHYMGDRSRFELACILSWLFLLKRYLMMYVENLSHCSSWISLGEIICSWVMVSGIAQQEHILPGWMHPQPLQCIHYNFKRWQQTSRSSRCHSSVQQFNTNKYYHHKTTTCARYQADGGRRLVLLHWRRTTPSLVTVFKCIELALSRQHIQIHTHTHTHTN